MSLFIECPPCHTIVLHNNNLYWLSFDLSCSFDRPTGICLWCHSQRRTFGISNDWIPAKRQTCMREVSTLHSTDYRATDVDFIKMRIIATPSAGAAAQHTTLSFRFARSYGHTRGTNGKAGDWPWPYLVMLLAAPDASTHTAIPTRLRRFNCQYIVVEIKQQFQHARRARNKLRFLCGKRTPCSGVGDRRHSRVPNRNITRPAVGREN